MTEDERQVIMLRLIPTHIIRKNIPIVTPVLNFVLLISKPDKTNKRVPSQITRYGDYFFTSLYFHQSYCPKVLYAIN